jgi:site-specific DNA recombinase
MFYGRVSTEDWQDPVTSRARQREQAGALVRGHGQIVAELFDVAESRTVAWARRPPAAALVAQLADLDRGWTDTELADPGNVTLGHKSVQRWNLPDGWVISGRPAHPALVGEDDFVGAQGISAARGPVPQAELVLRRYLLAGLLACGVCGRRMESAWSNGKPTYRCRHSRTSAMAPDPARPKNTYVREDKLLPHLPALHLLLTTPAVRARRRTRAGTDVTGSASPDEVIAYLREHEIAITWNPATATLQARATQTAKTVTIKAS